MVGSQSQVESVSGRIGGHQAMAYVGFDDLRDRRCDFDQREVADQIQSLRPAGVSTISKL